MSLFSALLLAACSPYDPQSDPAPNNDSDAPLTPPAGAIGDEGGTVSSGGVELDIPAGALDETVQIRIVDLGDDPPEPYQGLSTVWSFEPDGLTFDEPVTVRIPYDSHETPALFWSEGDHYVQLPATFEDGVATATIEHFSTSFVAVQPIEIHEEIYQPAPADFLFVIDNSCSMAEFQSQLVDQIPPMLETMTLSGLDYHIGVINTDMQDAANGQGKLRSIGGQNYIEPATTNPLQVFSLMANMGTSGWYDEKGRAAAYTMIEIRPDIPRNDGFVRDDATMDIVFLSDEEDQSDANPVTGGGFVTWMDTLKATPEMTRAHSITQVSGSLCSAVGSAGTQYALYASQTGGAQVDLCDADWTTPLQGVVDTRLAAGVIELPVEPSEVISVRFDGDSDLDLLPAEYTVDGARIRFDQGVVPMVGESVVVHYLP